MNQAEITKLLPRLKTRVNPRLRKFRNIKGPEERLNKLRKTVTALFKHERIELNYPRADEARMYAERLISDAIRYGDCHKTTMEMADYWLVEKQIVHKLFKVLVPRYENYNISFTRMWNAPNLSGADNYKKAVLELRGNPYPSLLPDTHKNRNLIHNVLLDEAKRAYRAQKSKEIANKIGEIENTLSKNSSIEENLQLKMETLKVADSSEKILNQQEKESDVIEKTKVKAEQPTENS